MADLEQRLLAARLALAKKSLTPPVQAEPEQDTASSIGDGISRGLGLAARDMVQGGAGLVGLAYDPIAATMNYALGTEVQPLRDQASNAMDAVGAPSPETAAERISGAIGEGMVGGGVMTGAANLAARGLQGVAGNVMGKLGSGIGSQTIAGGGAGLGQQGAAEAGFGEAGQVLFGLAGGLGAGAAAGKMARVPNTGAKAAIDGAGKIPVMTSDLFPPNTFMAKWAQKVGEAIPVAGTGGPRAAQNAARNLEIQDFLSQYGASGASGSVDDVAASLLSKRKADLGRYISMKGDVISSNSSAPVPVPNAINAIDTQIDNLSALNLDGLRPVVAALNDFKSALVGPKGAGQPLANVEEIRKALGQAFASPELASIRSQGEKALTAIYGPLREDMGAFIKANGAPRDYTKWSVANSRLAEMAGDLGVNVLKNVLRKGDATPEVVRTMLFSQKSSDLALLAKNLPPSGKAAARTAILDEVVAKAGGMENLSPERFKTALAKMGPQVNAFFSGADKLSAQGLVRALKLTSRASESSVSPPTGIQMLPVVGASAVTSLMGGMGSGLAAIAGIGGLARLYESPVVRNSLIALGRAKPAEEAAALRRLMASIQAATQKKEGK